MVNTLFLKHKTLGSAALRCGASSFGIKSMGKFSNYPSLFVAVFKSQPKRDKFLSYLRKSGMIYQTDFYYKYTIKNNQFHYLVFVKLYKFIPTDKIGFNSFRQFCKSNLITVYKNSVQHHPKNSLIN